MTLAGQAASLASALGAGPLVGLLGQLLQTSGAAMDYGQHLAGDTPKCRAEATAGAIRIVLRLLVVAAREHPVVWLVDDLDTARDFTWINLFLAWAEDIAKEASGLPVLLIATGLGPAASQIKHDHPDPGAFNFIAQRLARRRIPTEWLPLSRFTIGDIADSLVAADPNVVSSLLEITEGHPRWLADLWDDWRAEEQVRWLGLTGWEMRWKFAPGLAAPTPLSTKRTLSERLLASSAPGHEADFDEAMYLLECAALEGEIFTLEALAIALSRAPEDLAAILDGLVSAGVGVLRNAGVVTVSATGRRLHRYKFRTWIFWQALRSQGLDAEDRKLVSSALADALSELYGPELSRIGFTVARLLRAAGKAAAAAEVEGLVSHPAREELRQTASMVATRSNVQLDPWESRRNLDLLLHAIPTMRRYCPLRETLTICEAAYEVALRIGATADTIQTLRERASMHFELAEYAEATGLLLATLEEWGVELAAIDRARIFLELGRIALRLGDLARARDVFNQALNPTDPAIERSTRAAALAASATVHLLSSEYLEARALYQRAAEIYHVDGQSESEVLCLLGLARSLRPRRQYAAALFILQQIRAVSGQSGDIMSEAEALLDLGRVNIDVGKYRSAGELLRRAIDLFQYFGDRHNEAVALLDLSRTADALGRYDQAILDAIGATTIFDETGNEDWARIARAHVATYQQRKEARGGKTATHPNTGSAVTHVAAEQIGLDAAVWPIGLADDGQGMEEMPEPDVAYWWALGARVGVPGNLFLVGWYDQRERLRVFSRLRQLRQGDRLRLLDDNGIWRSYIVSWTRFYPEHMLPMDEIFAPSEHEEVTLLTSGGRFNMQERRYEGRLVVRARRQSTLPDRSDTAEMSR